MMSDEKGKIKKAAGAKCAPAVAVVDNGEVPTRLPRH